MASKNKKLGTNFIINLILTILAVICLFPIFLVLVNSFKSNAEIVRNPLTFPTVIHLENYIMAWQYGKFLTGFRNSILLVGCTIIIVLICSTLAGYVLSGKKIKGSGKVLSYFILATTVPIQLFLFPLYFTYAKLHIIGNIPATSFILSAISMPLAVLLMRTYFLKIPKELEEAARIDGAGTFQIIWHIMIPVIRPGQITVAILVGLQTWNEYLISSTFLQGEKSFTAPLGFLAMNGSYGANMGVLMASAMILIAPILIFFILCQRQFVDGMAAGAVKG